MNTVIEKSTRELDKVALSGKGAAYVKNVVHSYFLDNPQKDPITRDAVSHIATEVMSGLGVFKDSLVYKEAIIRKMDWLLIHINVTNAVNVRFSGRDQIWLTSVVNLCMDEGSSTWYNEAVMKIALPEVFSKFGVV